MTCLPIRTLLAAVLALAQLLVPFAHGPALAGTPGWTEVCTGDGVRRIASDDAPVAPLHDDDHCALCRIASPMAGVAPTVPALARQQADHVRPVTAAADPAGRPPLHDAPARGPPPVG